MKSWVLVLIISFTFAVGLPGQDRPSEPSGRPTRGGTSGRGERPVAGRWGLSSAGMELFAAVEAGDLEKVKTIIQSDGTLITASDRDGRTALHVAAEKGSKEMVEFLLTSGCQVDAESRRGQDTPLKNDAAAGNIAAAESLIAHKANVNHRNQFGSTPLTVVAEHGYTEMIQLLLKNKARVNLANDDGHTPTDIAKSNKQDAAF